MRLVMSCQLRTKVIASLAFTMIATAAFAHAHLRRAVPPVGGVVTASPKEIRLKFSEGVEPHFSGIDLASASGEAVAVGKAGVDPADNSVLVVGVGQPLKPGLYKVTWHALSVDTHRTQGSFEFTVQP